MKLNGISRSTGDISCTYSDMKEMVKNRNNTFIPSVSVEPRLSLTAKNIISIIWIYRLGFGGGTVLSFQAFSRFDITGSEVLISDEKLGQLVKDYYSYLQEEFKYKKKQEYYYLNNIEDINDLQLKSFIADIKSELTKKLVS